MGEAAYSPDGIKNLEDLGATEVIVAFRNAYEGGEDERTLEGMIAEINNLIDLYHKKYSSLKVFITGGDLDFIYPMVDNQKSSIFAHNYITLLGMHTILQENVS